MIPTNCKHFYSFLGPYINSCGARLTSRPHTRRLCRRQPAPRPGAGPCTAAGGAMGVSSSWPAAGVLLWRRRLSAVSLARLGRRPAGPLRAGTAQRGPVAWRARDPGHGLDADRRCARRCAGPGPSRTAGQLPNRGPAPRRGPRRSAARPRDMPRPAPGVSAASRAPRFPDTPTPPPPPSCRAARAPWKPRRPGAKARGAREGGSGKREEEGCSFPFQVCPCSFIARS